MSRGRVAPHHDGRKYIPKNADIILQKNNTVILKCDSVRDKINDFFHDTIEQYNSKQKRKDRQKDFDYYTALVEGREGYGKGDAQEQPVYEYVIQIGDNNTNGVTNDKFDVDHWETLKKDGKIKDASDYILKHLNKNKDKQKLKTILNTIGQKFVDGELSKNFLPLYAYGHDDEPGGTYHLHIGFCPFVEGEKRGLSKRVSLTKALQAMGYTGNSGEAIQEWQRDVMDRVTAEMQKQGYERAVKNNHKKHLSVDAFKLETKCAQLESQIAELDGELEGSKIGVKYRRAKKLADKAKQEAEKAKKEQEEAEQATEKIKKEREETEKELKDIKQQTEEARIKAQEAQKELLDIKHQVQAEKDRVKALQADMQEYINQAEQITQQLQSIQQQYRPKDQDVLKYLVRNKTEQGQRLYDYYAQKTEVQIKKTVKRIQKPLTDKITQAKQQKQKQNEDYEL